MYVGIMGVGDDWGDYFVIVLLMFFGLDVMVVYLIWNGVLMWEGEVMFFEFFGCYCCYYVLISCMVFFGMFMDDMLCVEEVQFEGIEVGFEVVCVGNWICDIVNVFMDVFVKYGIECFGCMGYFIGLSYLFDWGECMVLICIEDEIVL